MSMSWIQTKPGGFERKRGFMGDLYHGWASSVGEPDTFGPTSTVQFKHRDGSNNLEADLRKAWLQTLYKFPTLVAVSEPGAVAVSIGDEDAWLSRTFLTHPDQTADEFLARKIKYQTAVLHYFPSSSELNLDIDHQYIDGRGFAFFWDGFFTTLQNLEDIPKPDSKTLLSRLPRPMEDMLGVPLESSKMGQTIAKGLLAQMASGGGKPIGMPADVSKQPANTRRQTLKLDQETTKFVLDTAKEKGYSFVAAYQTAVILAVQEFQRRANPDTVGDMYTTESFFDMRRYYPSDFDPRHNPIVGCHCVLPSTIRTTDKTYGDLVAELTGFFRAGFDNPAIKDIWKDTFPALSKMIAQTRRDPSMGSTTPSISNVGQVDGILKHEYGPWEIVDYFFFISLGSPLVPIALWTWRGRLHMRACFNDGYYTADEIEKLLERSRDILLENLRQ